MPLHYELEVLDDLISGILDPKNPLYENTITDHQFENWNDILMHEKVDIRKRLKKATYCFVKENRRIIYIRQHQNGITRLINMLVDFLMPKDAGALQEMNDDENLVRLYKRCLSALHELLIFIQEEFKHYFNEDERIPANKFLIIEQELKPQLVKIKKYLTKAGHDPVLADLIPETISQHCCFQNCNELTYRKFSYLKTVMNALEKVNPDKIMASHYPTLPALLVYLNFNATSFKNYLVKLIYSEINTGASIEDKIETISFHHKEISQLSMKPGMSLSPAMPSVQLDLVTWLFTEMSHLEKKQTLGIVAPIQFKDGAEMDGEKGIYSQLTVEELALFLKSLKETGLVKNKNMKQVARCMAEDWHSKQKEHISWQYLYNSMSTYEMNTISGLDSKLMDVVNWLRKMRGGLKIILFFFSGGQADFL
jgi:hypothetical protein